MNAEETAQSATGIEDPSESNQSPPSSLLGLLLNSSTLTTDSATLASSSITPHATAPFAMHWPPVTQMNNPGMQIPFPFNSHLAYPQFMPNPYTYGTPAYNMFTVGSTFPNGPDVQRPSSSGFIQLAPKPTYIQAPKSAPNTGPPDFIETIKKIRAQLYDMADLDECEDPPTEGKVFSAWRKSVIEAEKPVSYRYCFSSYYHKYIAKAWDRGRVLFYTSYTGIRAPKSLGFVAANVSFLSSREHA